MGMAAKSQVASNPRNTVYDVKRIIGRSFSDPVVAEEAKAFPFEVVEGSAHGEPQIVVDWRGEKKELRPEEISAMVLAGEWFCCMLHNTSLSWLHVHTFHISCISLYLCHIMYTLTMHLFLQIKRIEACRRTSSWPTCKGSRDHSPCSL